MEVGEEALGPFAGEADSGRELLGFPVVAEREEAGSGEADAEVFEGLHWRV